MNRVITLMVVLKILLLASVASGQIRSVSLTKSWNNVHFPGPEVVRSDQALRSTPVLLTSVSDTSKVENKASSKPIKSPRKAFLFSALVPGTGELYAGTKRGILFLGIEATMWTGYALLSKKGKDIERDFQKLADEHWDNDRFLVWKENYVAAGYDTMRFTHTLPEKKDQQYYELIGKYDQFVAGWDDFIREPDSPDSSGTSKERLNYEDKRFQSNKHLKRASYALGVLFFNHLVSAIDAARYAAQRNESQASWDKRLKIRMALLDEGDKQVPMIFFSKRF